MDAKLRFERCTEPSMIKLAEKLLDINSVATIPLPQSTSAPKPLPDDRI
jgi:hypothetical protein